MATFKAFSTPFFVGASAKTSPSRNSRDSRSKKSAGVRRAEMNDSAILVCGPLSIEFVDAGDRIGRRIWLGSVGERLLAESIEGGPDEAWPASPPLQDLHFESRDGQKIALLVGQAGKSHWSASIEPCQRGAIVDVACRLKGAVGHVLSSYRLTDGRSDWIRPDDDGAAKCRVTVDGDRLEIVPASAAGGTVRWRYRLEPA
jgi:hypothetical protein